MSLWLIWMHLMWESWKADCRCLVETQKWELIYTYNKKITFYLLILTKHGPQLYLPVVKCCHTIYDINLYIYISITYIILYYIKYHIIIKMFLYIYIYIHIYIHTHIYIYIYIQYIYINTYTHTHTHIYIYIYIKFFFLATGKKIYIFRMFVNMKM